MEAGKVNIPYSSFLGYRKGPDGLPEIVEKEARIIRNIYQRFLQGASLKAIADELNQKGIETPTGKDRCKWTNESIRRILTNEKYKGDARLQKTYTVDFLTKEVKVNHGERKQWYVHNSHAPIVSSETFELAQKELARRTGRRGRFYDSPFTGKIICGDCGSYYGHRVWHSNDKYRENIWICNSKYDGKVKCRPPRVKDEEIKKAYIIVANRLLKKKNWFIGEYENDILPMIGNTEILDKRLDEMTAELNQLIDTIEELVENNARHIQDQKVYAEQFNSLNESIGKKKAAIESIKIQISDALSRRENVRIFLEGLKSINSIVQSFDIESWHSLVEYIKIMPDQTIVFHLRNGLEETVYLAEAQ